MADDTLKIELELDESTLNNEIKKANSLLAKGFNNVVIDIDTKKVDTEIKSIEKKLATLNASKNILLKAEQTPETKRVLDDIEKRITSLTQQKQINLSIKQANTSSLKDIEKQIKTLTDKRNEIELTADTAKASKELDEIDAQLDELDQVKQIKIQIDQKNLSSINSAVNGIGKAGAVAFGALTVATTATAVGMFNLATSASDAQEATSKLYNVFNDVATENVAESINELVRSYGFARSEAEALLGSTGNVLAGIGFVGDEALSTAVEIQKLSADLVSFTNYSGGVAGASEILTKALLGERDALQALDIKISEGELQRKMQAMGYENLTGKAEQLAKTEATMQLLYEKSNKALGDYNRTADGFANQQRLTTALMSDLGVTLGNMILPYLEELIIDFNQALITITDFVSENDELKDSFATLTTAITGFLKNGLDKILENLPKIISNIASFIDTIGFLISNLNVIVPIIAGFATVLLGIKVAMLAVTGAFTAFNLVTGGIILAIGALVTAIVYMIKNWEQVSFVVQQVMETVKYYVNMAGVGLETAFVVSIDAIKKAFFSIVDMVADKVIPAIMNITGALAKIPFLADEMEGVNSALEKSKNFIDNLAKASKEELDITIQTQKDKTQAYKDEYERRMKILEAEKTFSGAMNAEMLEDAKNTNQQLSEIQGGETKTEEEKKQNQDLLDTKLEQEINYLEARKKLIEQTVLDEQEKNTQILEAEKESLEARKELLEEAMLDQLENGGDIAEIEIAKEASVTGDTSTAIDEYNTLAQSIENVSKQLNGVQVTSQSLAEYMSTAFGASMFDGLVIGVNRVTEAFTEMQNVSGEGTKDAVGKFTVAITALSLETASVISDIWGAVNELQNAQMEAQLQKMEEVYTAQTEALEKRYEAETEAVSEQVANQEKIKTDSENKISELEEEKDALEEQRNEAMTNDELIYIQNLLDAKNKQINEEMALLSDAERAHEDLLNKQIADEKAYEAEKEALDKKYAYEKAVLERKQAEKTKELNIFNAILSMAQGIASAIAGAMTLGPIAGPIMAGINSALVATLAGIQIATIKAQPLPTIPAYATGGLVTRANEGNYTAFGLTPPNSQDNQLAWLSTGERVLTARENQMYETNSYGNNTENIYNTYDINIQATDGMNTRAIAKAVVREIGGRM